MNHSFLYDLLIDPLTKEALVPDESFTSLKSTSGGIIYNIIGSVPRIITGDSPSISGSELHNSQQSVFHYQDHYQVDAELFDYSEKDETAATKHEIRRLHESICLEIKGEKSLILDTGCGNGWAAQMLVPKEHRVISMDISTKNPIDSVHKTSDPNHAGLIADVYNLPFRDETFDYIIASEIMEHVPDPAYFITRLLSVLKKDGKLIITTPYNEKIEYCLCVHCNRMTPRHAHLHSFNENNIKEYLPTSGIHYNTTVYSNKYLARIYSHLILKHFPFIVWKTIDNFFNLCFRKSMRFKVVIVRSGL